jgi:hypothetical protein
VPKPDWRRAGEAQQSSPRWLTVAEAGLGLSILGRVISYLPVFYESFSRRELHISLLDAREGSPPTAAELIARQAKYPKQFERQLASWEKWAADLLQDELSYPMMAYFRSQHLNQSWVGALVTITDTSALIMLGAQGELRHQAEATFAMARHALVDSVKVLRLKPGPDSPNPNEDRLPSNDLQRIRRIVAESGAPLDSRLMSVERVGQLRASYETKPRRSVLTC